nr:luciferase [synthetic construct]
MASSMMSKKDLEDKNVVHGPDPYYLVDEGNAGQQLHKTILRYAQLPDTIAFTDGHTKRDVTYAHYFDLTCRLAESLKRYGLNLQSRIAVCSENNVEFFIPVVASLYLGVGVAPTNDIYNETELFNSLNISQPTIVFVSKRALHKILEVKKRIPIIKTVVVLDTEEDFMGYHCLHSFMKHYLPPNFDIMSYKPEEFARDGQLALIMNSSGSTGLPKGVMLAHRSVVVRFSHCKDPVFGNQIIPDTAILTVIPFHHGFGMFTTLGYLTCGFRIVLLRKFDEHYFLKCLQDYKIQFALLVPTLFSFFAKSTLVDQYDLSNLKEIASGGAPLAKEVGEAVAKRFKLPGIRQGYGLTETTSAVIITPEGEDKPGSTGKVVPFFSAKIVDLNSGKSVGPHQRGELYLKGDMIMMGYCNNKAATDEMIDKDGWLHSGDVAYYDEDGHFFIVDRLKSLIKYKGYQVAPAELEAVLLQHPCIFDAGVTGVPDDVDGELPGACVVLEKGKHVTEQEVMDYVAGQLSCYKRLRGGVRFIDEIPKGLTGKIDRKALKEILKKPQSKM